MSAAATTKPLRARIASLLRSRRLRTSVLLVAGYKAYTSFKTHTTLNKTFSAARHRPGQTVLDLDLDAVNLVPRESLTPLAAAEELRLARLVAALHRARDDPRVAALVVRGISGLRGVGLAEIAELRSVIRNFSAGPAGKPSVLHVPEGLGAAGNGTIPLYFASAFDSVHVQPTSIVIIPGISLATLFFRRLLENVGVRAKKVARKEFKTAANSFTEEKFTEPHRVSTEALLSAIMTDIVRAVADGRSISESAVRDAMDTAILTPAEAHTFGILDEPLYRDQLPELVRERLRVAEEMRADIRGDAEVEWRHAMSELKRVWQMEGGSQDMWNHGAILDNCTKFETALPTALSFADQRVELTKQTIAAEIRALKAHLRWLDTCPWEADQGKGDDKHTEYRTNANISSSIEVERRLCENAVRTLQECPQLLETYRQAADDESVLKLDEGNALSLIRWCRGMWRAKCMAARIVGTLLEVEENLVGVLEPQQDKHIKLDLEALAARPRLFLVALTDELNQAAEKMSKTDNLANDDQAEQPSVDYKDMDAPSLPMPELNGTAVQSEKEEADTSLDEKKKNLRYVKFSDYLDVLESEKRAVLDRSGSRSFVKISSNDPFNKLPGSIDLQERNALLRLQLPGMQFAPWRLSVPKGDAIAIITLEGAISDEGADITRSAIRRADKDPNIKAIVLRIDSPGGSATASDLISRAVEVAKKPIVASMSNVCASGGYFISAPCDKVFACNTTITGSIGVIFSAFNTAGLFEKVGITADSCESGRFSKYFGAQGSITEWSEEFASRIDTMIDHTYSDFVNAVAKGRGMPFEKAESIAKGRVWAGSDALALGLVDEIGGLREAIQAAAELAYLAPDAEVQSYDYPTVAMQVQDAARKRGIIPSNLDEEGDEAVPQRRRGWFQPRQKRLQDGSDVTDSPREGELAPAALMARLEWEYANLQHFVADSVFSWLHNFLLSESGSSPTAEFIEMLLGRVAGALGRGKAMTVIAEEAERTRATAGRPAAIAPHFRVDN